MSNDGSTSGPITGFPAQGLRNIQRVITGRDGSGKDVFLATDNGDHHGVMVNGIAVQNNIYSTSSVPAELNDDTDFNYAKETAPGVVTPNGTIVRMIDFAPGVQSNMHRSIALVYGVVIEGEFEVSLGGGEQRKMLPGDMIVNRSSMHRWRNTSPDKPGRMLFVLLDVKPVVVNGETLQHDLGNLADEYPK